MRAPACLLLAPALLAGLIATASAHAQQGAVLRITVTAVDDARALAGVQVLVMGSGLGGVTNQHGVARIGGIPEGTRVVEVTSIGFERWSRPVVFEHGRLTEIAAALTVDTIGLPAIEVAATRSNLTKRGFFDRKRAGAGSFFTRQQLEEMQIRFLSDLLRRVGGINVGASTRGQPPARIRGQQTIAGSCPIQFFVDGVLAALFNIDEVRPEDVDGIEVYRGAATIPAAFKRGTATCGVIVVWTRIE